MSRMDECLRELDRMNIPYTLAQHEPVFTMEECRLPESILGACMPRNLFLCPRTRSCFCLLSAHPDSVFRTSSVSRQAGVSRLSFADEADMESLIGTYPGCVSPLGLVFDKSQAVRYLFDERLLKEAFLLFHPVDNRASVRISAEDLLEKFLPLTGHRAEFIKME